MKTSDSGRALIEAFEGLFLTAYRDVVNVLTIGYGHTNAAGPPAVVPGMKITAAQADDILAADLAAVEKNVANCITVPLKQSEFDALMSFDFNTGSLNKSSLDEKINSGNKAAAMVTLLQYNHAGGKVYAGLTRRRQAEKMLFEGDVAGALSLAGAHMARVSNVPPPPPKPAQPAPAPQPASGGFFNAVANFLTLFKKEN